MPKTKIILTLSAILLLVVAGVKLAKFINQAPVPKINQVQAQTGFVPNPNSPLGKGEHPRLHITQNTLPYFRDKIATYYSSEFQDFVNWVDANFDVDEDGNAGYMSEYHALIYLLGAIPGIEYQHDIVDYGQRAIEIMMNEVAANPSGVGKAHGYLDDLYARLACSYDWAWDLMADEQKTIIANWLADNVAFEGKGFDSDGTISSLFSSMYFESYYPWYVGLAFYGDGIRDEKAQYFVDGFEEFMLNGKWLDAQNWVARNQGGISELGNYGSGHPVRHIINIDGWRTATGENYFVEGTSVADAYFAQYYPQYSLYRIKPFGKVNPGEPGGVEWKSIKVGQMSAGEGVLGDQVILLLGEALKTVNPNMASLNRWILENRTGDKVNKWNSKWYYPRYFLWGDRSVTAQSPQQLGLPISQYFEGLGMAIMRTGFDDINDTSLLVLAPNYRLGGHDWGPWTAIPAGFTIDKYGPLAIKQMGYLRGDIGYSFRKNIMRFTDPLTTPDSGFGSSTPETKDIRDYTPGSPLDIGGMKSRIFENDYDYLYMDYTKYYAASGRVANYTRQFVYLRPDTNQDSDYIVVFDRTETTRPDIIKRWALNMAYDPQINGEGAQVREGKWEYTNADQIVISNNVDPDPYNGVSHGGHGRLFVKSLLPQQKKIVKVGGPGHEFENDAGEWVGDSDMPYLEERGAFYTGTYYTDVVALDNDTQENFLHVLQTADANLVSEMAPVSRIDGDKMVGAYIQDDIQGHKVTMFSRTEENQAQAAYSIESSQKIKHLITDLWPSTNYDVYQDEKQIKTASASEQGTIYFSSKGGGDFELRGIGINIPPTVEVSANPISGQASLTVQFTATAEDSDGTVDSYSWNFGDTGTSTEQNPSHTYTSEGIYNATLTVTDDGGAEASDTITITVEAPPPDSTPPTIPQGLSSTGQYETSVSLTWQASSDPETGVDFYKVYRDGTEIDTTGQTNYTDTGLTVDTAYSYEVSAVNGIGLESGKSNLITVTTQADTAPPTVVSVTTESTTQVKIVFSETIEEISAEEPNNYNIDQGITISNASLAPNQTTVTLTTSVLNEQSTYTLTINNIIDQTISPNSIAPDTTVTFRGTNFIAHWAFDEGTGQTAQDSSGDNPGTIYGAVWTTGKINGALEFDGIDDYVDFSGLPTVFELTLAAWVKRTNLSNLDGQYIFHIPHSDSIGRFRLADGKSLELRLKGTNVRVDSDSTIEDTDWHFVVATWDGSEVRIYIDGNLRKTGDISATSISISDVKIGSYHTGSYVLEGLIDDVRIYNCALTAGQIQELYEPSIATPELTLTKSADVSEAAPGQTIIYTITYQNIGQGQATNAVITDPIPEGTSYVSGGDRFEDNTVYWDIGVIEAGGGGSVEMQVRVE